MAFDTGVLVETGRASQRVARLRCGRSTSLAGCFTAAPGEEMGSSPFSPSLRGEFVEEVKRRPSEIPILFLDEILSEQTA